MIIVQSKNRRKITEMKSNETIDVFKLHRCRLNNENFENIEQINYKKDIKIKKEHQKQ